MFVILGGEKSDEDDQVSFLAGMTFLVGSIVLSAVLPVLSTVAYFTYRREMYEVNAEGVEVSKKFPILMWTSLVMMSLYIVQFLAGVILWFKSKYPDWCIVVIVAEVFAMSGLIMVIAVKAWRSAMKPYVRTYNGDRS
jgi:hypothetical protein